MAEKKAIHVYETQFTDAQREGLTVGHGIPGWGGKERGMSSIPKDWKPVRGATYAIKEDLKEMGARWDRDTGLWWIAPEKARAAYDLVEERGG